MKFCIVGTGRCGTKLLGTAFHSHPDLAVFNESHWIPKMYEFFGEQKVAWRALLHIAENTSWVGGESLLEVNYLQSEFNDYGEFLEALQIRLSHAKVLNIQEFSNILAGILYGDTVSWGDKTPDYGYYMGLLHQLWPSCKFIHLVRRPLATAHSMAKHPGFKLMVSSGHDNWCSLSFDQAYKGLQLSEPGIRHYLQYWSRRVKRIRDEATRIPPTQYREVSYEALVSNPCQTLENLACFIGAAPGQPWLDAFSERVDSSKLVSHFIHSS